MENTDIALNANISNLIVYDLWEFKSHSMEQGFLAPLNKYCFLVPLNHPV